jgi:ubiquinone biosynthesis protein Coq4
MSATPHKKQKVRDTFVLKILDKMLALHHSFYSGKRASWNITRANLLQYPTGSLGRELALFLEKENFHSIPTIERHDVFHLLFGFETHVKDEIAMLCFLVGNGKRTPFTLLSAIGASLIYPENYFYFIRHFKRGRHAMNICNWDFRPFLNENIYELRGALFLQNSCRDSIAMKIKQETKKTTYN